MKSIHCSFLFIFLNLKQLKGKSFFFAFFLSGLSENLDVQMNTVKV